MKKLFVIFFHFYIKNPNSMIKVYTDGSYKPSTDQGGFASIITENDEILRIIHKGFIHTTNNRMELYGILSALEYFLEPTEFEIYSDSTYVVNSINRNFVGKWLLESDESKKNMDLWSKIETLMKKHSVKFKWIKGHNNNTFNELADLYANISAIIINPEEDVKT